jgi:dTDP-4-dehydrorhamnose reductase
MAKAFSIPGDLAKAMVILGKHEVAIGQVWHVPNAKTISIREMLNLLFAELNQKKRNF